MGEEIQYDFQRVADAIQADIVSGRIPLGGALPNERALAEVHHVSAGTVRRAVRELRERGWVQTLPGKGSFVIAKPESSSGG